MKRNLFIGVFLAVIVLLIATAGFFYWQNTTKPRLSMAKPVIYLYPPTPTEVSITIGNVQLDTDIPTYKDKWHILASPSGTLKDLQPQFTDCMSINTTRYGLEYAGTACKKNEYPYIYWAGKSSKSYPVIKEGWIVKKDEITQFLNAKLSELGLSPKEKFDMMEYWVPQIIQRPEPYFRMAFLTNKEMDELAPLNVNPAPDTTIRVFLDYLPLKDMPRKLPLPQDLPKPASRSGFVLVEWGGVRR